MYLDQWAPIRLPQWKINREGDTCDIIYLGEKASSVVTRHIRDVWRCPKWIEKKISNPILMWRVETNIMWRISSVKMVFRLSVTVCHRIHQQHITHIQLIESTIEKWHTKSFVLIECTPNLHCQVKILSDLLQYHYNPIFQFQFMYPRISTIHFTFNWDPFSMVSFIYLLLELNLKYISI